MRNTVSKQLVELRSSPNVNHTFWNVQFQKDFSTPQDFGSGEFLLCILLEDNGIIYIDIRKQAMRICVSIADTNKFEMRRHSAGYYL